MKKTFFLLSVLTMLVMMPISYGLYPDWADQMDARSPKDPIYIEMDDSLPVYMPATVRVYINDPLVLKEANYVEIFAGNSIAYSQSGKEISIDSSGAFRQTLPYNGEKVIEFGFRPSGMVGDQSSVDVNFYKAVKVDGNDYPDTTTPGGDLYQYNCHIEGNDLFCPGDKDCLVCGVALGVGIRGFAISGSEYSITVPGRFSFEKYTDGEERLQESAAFERFSYDGKKTMTYWGGHTTEIPDQYSLEFDFSDTYWTAAEWGERNRGFHESQGFKQGTCSAGICEFYRKDVKTGGDWEPVGVTYDAYVDVPPKGLLRVKASRNTGMEKGAGDAEAETVLSEIRAFAKSYSQSRGRVYTKDNLLHTYTTRGAPVAPKEPETTELKVWGTVADADTNPMPFVDMQVEVKGKTFTGRTDINGDFSIPITGLELSDSEDAKLFITLDYEREGTKYFKLYFLNGNTYKEIYYGKKFKIEDQEDVEFHIVMDGRADRDAWLKPTQPMSNLKHFSVMYYHLHEAVEFTINTLGEKMDYDMPVEVLVGNTDKETLYTPDKSRIKIAIDDAGYSSTNRPDNREYHEFMHAVMYDVYGSWPEGRLLDGTRNHDGYINPSTADSYMEGFAEFMSLVISKVEHGERSPDVYADFGSLEKNYHPWDGRGYDEEFAVASVLWDLYDDKDDAGDSVSLMIEDMWKVLKVKRKNFDEYYQAFLEANPRKQDAIKKVFEEHGFFADTTQGNGKWDRFEPIRDLNKNGRHDANEFFVDLGAKNSTEEIKYRKGMVLGPAADYKRTNRTNAVRVPGAYLAVDKGARLFKVTVGDTEFTTEAREGMIYVQPLPSGYDEEIRIEPLNMRGEPYTIRSTELESRIAAGKDTFDSHEFDAQGKENYTGMVDSPGFTNNDIDRVERLSLSDEDEKTSPRKFPWGMAFLFLVIGATAVFLYRNPSARSGIARQSRIAHRRFMDHGMPKIRHAAKKTGEFTVKTAKTIAHHTKRSYNQLKPRVKKMGQDIGNKVDELKRKLQKR